MLKTGRLCKLSIELMDKPGQLRDVSTIIASCGANVVSVNYEHAGKGSNVNDCVLTIEMETKNSTHIKEVEKALTKAGFHLL